MALIAKFEERPLAPRALHDPVTCGYRVVELDGQSIVQLETYGRPGRENPRHGSQKIQLDESAARELRRILDRAFPGLGS